MKPDYILALSAFASIVLLVLAGVLRKKIRRGSMFALPLDFAILLFFLAALITSLWLNDKNPILFAAAVGSAVLIVGGGFLAVDSWRNSLIKKPVQSKTAP